MLIIDKMQILVREMLQIKCNLLNANSNGIKNQLISRIFD